MLATMGVVWWRYGGALDLGSRRIGGVTLGLRQECAPCPGEATEGAAHVLAGRGLLVLGHHELALALAIAALERDDVPTFAALGNIEDFHKTMGGSSAGC